MSGDDGADGAGWDITCWSTCETISSLSNEIDSNFCHRSADRCSSTSEIACKQIEGNYFTM